MTQNKLNNLYNILANIIVTACLTACGPKLTPEQKAMYCFISKFTSDTKKTHGLDIFGTGFSNFKGGRAICIHYLSKDTYTINEARILLITIALDMLKKMNSDESLIINFPIYPFNKKNIETGILFSNAPEDSYSLKSVVLINGTLSYIAYPPLGGESITLLQETFEEALEIFSQTCNN